MVRHSVFEKVGVQFATKGISERVRGLTVSAIKEMSILALDKPDTINLAWGLPSFETPLHIREGVREALLSNPLIGKYAPPPGLNQLKRLLAERLQRDKGVTADPGHEIMVTAGAMQGLMMIWLTILNAGDEVLVTSPGFSSHYEQIGLAGGVAVGVPLVEQEGWRIDIEAYRQAITPRTKALIIVNPSNPTGTFFPEADLRALDELALEHDLFVITDDPYEFISYNGQRPFSLLSIPELRGKVISCFSFSKEFAMTGWRVGWIYAAEGIINQLLKVHDAMVICAPTISQIAATIALQGSYEATHGMVRELTSRRALVCERLDRLPDLFSYHKPDGAYYIFPKLEHPKFQDDMEFCIKLLAETGVVIVPGSAFGPTGAGHIRISYCVSEEELASAFDRIEKWWASVKQH
jgi:aminotransferase